MDTQKTTVIIIFGASGDLSCKKIFPALWTLFKSNSLPLPFKIVGFARSAKSVEEFVSFLKCHIIISPEEANKFLLFIEKIAYRQGDYKEEAFKEFENYLDKIIPVPQERIFYFSLPPSVYTVAAFLTRQFLCKDSDKWPIVLEKPFGYDLASAQSLNSSIIKLFDEENIYRIDHYLGKEMVQNIMAIRFANFVLSSLWDRHHVANVMISFKENIGTLGRGNYYDSSGVIRDIIQNHMIQVLSLLGMEQPASLSPSDIKDAKCMFLKQILPIRMEDIVIGQYQSDSYADPLSPSAHGYKDDPLVRPDSRTPTFANIILYVNNERWAGVPFILKAGKALNDRKAEIRIQFKPLQDHLFAKEGLNELVIRMQPDDAIYLKLLLKMPGPGYEMETSELDLTYKERHKEYRPQEAYEKLILDVITRTHINFVRSDELEESWRIFTPILEHLEANKVEPLPYQFGSRGPLEADKLNASVGFKYDPNYKWSK